MTEKLLKTVLESGQYVMGPMLKSFESELAAYHGSKYAIGLANADPTSAPLLPEIGVTPGDAICPT